MIIIASRWRSTFFFYFWQFDLSVCVFAWYMLWPNQMNILRLLLTMICQKKMLLSPMAEIYIYDICWFNLYLFWRTKTLVIWYIDLELLWLMPTGNVLWNCLWGFFQSRSDCYKTKWTNTFYPHILWTNAIFFSFFGQVCNCFHFLISHCSHCLVCANGIQQISCKK